MVRCLPVWCVGCVYYYLLVLLTSDQTHPNISPSVNHGYPPCIRFGTTTECSAASTVTGGANKDGPLLLSLEQVLQADSSSVGTSYLHDLLVTAKLDGPTVRQVSSVFAGDYSARDVVRDTKRPSPARSGGVKTDLVQESRTLGRKFKAATSDGIKSRRSFVDLNTVLNPTAFHALLSTRIVPARTAFAFSFKTVE